MKSGGIITERIVRGDPPSSGQIVCPLFPDCECQGCIAGNERRRAMGIVYGLAAATVLIGAGVILAGLR